jgi:hypothetical protein
LHVRIPCFLNISLKNMCFSYAKWTYGKDWVVGKLCPTTKGPWDRRVQLSVHTSIQFYDVQDWLGYDRPSKAVDWLIKAKSTINKLAELPPWHPTAEQADPNAGATEITIAEKPESSGYNFQLHKQLAENPNENSNFIPPALDSEAMTDNMKFLFPTTSATSSSISRATHLI